jgi:hypothetical protein
MIEIMNDCDYRNIFSKIFNTGFSWLIRMNQIDLSNQLIFFLETNGFVNI